MKKPLLVVYNMYFGYNGIVINMLDKCARLKPNTDFEKLITIVKEMLIIEPEYRAGTYRLKKLLKLLFNE